MHTDTGARFESKARIHIALAVRDLGRARAFYRSLLGVEPTKERPGYLRFESETPALNLALNETGESRPHADPQHFGIQVKSRVAVSEALARLQADGHATRSEEQVTCCYAVQDKLWVDDPDGHRWEVFIVTDDTAELYSEPAAETPCCEPTCCT